MKNWTKAEQNKIAYLVITLFALAWMSMKLSLPVLPILESVFHTTPSLVKMSVTLFFACYALSQPIWASLSEKKGRRRIVLYGIVLSCLGTLLVICSQSIEMYMVGRCLEGAGIGVASPVGRAILADVFDSVDMARTLAIVSAVTGLMPALAPIIGGFIVVGLGWRYVFGLFLLLLLGFLIWSAISLKETHSQAKRNLSLVDSLQSYADILSARFFWAYIVCYALTQGTLLGYYAAMPFWYVTTWHIPEQYYAFLAIFNVLAYVGALLLTRRFVKTVGVERLVHLGIIIGSLAALFALAAALLHITGPIPLVITLTILAFSSGIIFPTANAAILFHFKSAAAPASALSSTFMFLMAAVFSWIESHLHVITLWPVAILLWFVSGMIWFVHLSLNTKNTKTAS